MKKILTVFVIVAVLTACSNESDNKEPSSYLGTELRLSGDVYLRYYADDMENILTSSSNIITYHKDGTINSEISDNDLGGSGEINNGKLSYSIRTPGDEHLIPLNEVLLELLSASVSLPENIDFPTINISSDDAKAVPLILMIEDDPEYVLLTREKIVPNINIQAFQFSIVIESTSYIYIDKNTNISADKFTYTYTFQDVPIGEIFADTPISLFPIADPMDIPVKLTVQKINLSFKKGWNAIHGTFSITVKPTKPLALATPLTFGAEANVKISSGNPSSLYWVLNSEDGESFPFP